LGEAYKTTTGDALIVIDNRLTEGQILAPLAHEIGHCLHFDDLRPSDPDKALDEVDKKMYSVFKSQPAYRAREDKAQSSADIWLAWVAQHWQEYGTDEMCKLHRSLLALEHYLPPEMQAVVDTAVEKAVKSALRGLYPRYVLVEKDANTISENQAGGYYVYKNSNESKNQ
jgi:hypothetical protein